MHIARSTIDSDDILQRITRAYGYPSQGAACMLEYRGVNDIYRYICGRITTYLKVYTRPEINLDAVEAEVGIVNHLRRSGLSVAYPIPTVDGRPSITLEAPEGIRHAVLFSEAEGLPCDNDALDDAQTAQIGQLFAAMHAALDVLPAPVQRWRLDETTFLDRSMEILEAYSRLYPQLDLPFLRDVVAELKTQLRANGAGWNWGLCHGDLYTGNIHRNARGELTLLDFDFCGYSWRAYDVSPFLGSFGSGMSAEMIERRKRRLPAFLRGYETAGHLSDSEIDAVYRVFVPFRRIFNMGYLYELLLYVWGNRLRHEQITRDLNLLKHWVSHYGLSPQT